MKLIGVMVNSENSKDLADFYTRVFGEPGMKENGFFGFDIGGNWLMIGPHSEVHGKSKEPPRVMISVETPTINEDFEKFKSAGADVIAEPYKPGADASGEFWLATLADPDGNYLQLSSPWKA